ncbi:MAG: universal stress protein [Deltaproteobacteria bacterium]|nr:universal stress protein [Deltaproteobacteria bacterium]
MFNKILVCVDPYPPGNTLLSCVLPLKNCGATEVILAHIFEADTPGLDNMLLAQARPEMERQQRLLEEAGFKVSMVIRRGVPAQDLHNLAEMHDVSVIAVGTHGRGLPEAIALGSVSARLLHTTHRPVLLNRATMPEKAAAPASRDLFAHILFPTDFSDTAEVAFTYLETMVSATNCRATLLHVQDNDRPAPHFGHRLPALRNLDTTRLQRLQLWLERSGATKVGVEVIQGNPGDEVVKMAKAKDCSLILMGTQGKGITRELLLGSVAHQVVRHAAQPVLLIPALQ